MSQFHFTPDDYLDLMHAEVPAYELLQDRVAEGARGMSDVSRILELGTGTGETSRRVLGDYTDARMTGIDVSEEMLARARATLPTERIEDLLVRGIEEALPEGPFDLAISALTVHHLRGPDKADLFRRLAAVLRPGGRFVMGDVVTPVRSEDAITPISDGYDFPSSTEDLLTWLNDAGFNASITWAHKDLAVIAADLPR